MYAKVIIDSKSRYLDRGFTYHIPESMLEDLTEGKRVLVPFGRGNKPKVAFVYQLVCSVDGDFDLKDIIKVLDREKIVSDELIKLAFFMGKRYLSPMQAAIRQVLPPGSFGEIKEYFYSRVEGESELLDFLQKKREYGEIVQKFGDVKKDLRDLVREGKLAISYETKSSTSIKYREFVKLRPEFDEGKIKKNAVRQLAIVDFLKKEGETDLKSLLSKTGSSRKTLEGLEAKGLVEIRKIEADKSLIKKRSSYDKLKLNEEQERAYRTIRENEFGKYVLEGVTGSGKTEVFLHLVEENLKEGKDTIILVPEISLTPQTIQRFTGRFNERVAVIHSRLTPQERFNQWAMIKSGETKIVIGARSAIFAPFDNLGLIVIDEEHDSSYISGQDPKYNTREVAEFRADYNKANMILASATPCLESIKKTENGDYKLLKLKKRVNNRPPRVDLVDMRQELKASNYSMISRRLYQEIGKTLKEGNQAILFLNKIGHDSFTFCRACGYVVKCEACDVAMTYHKSVDKLVCHYCGRTKNQPKICPSCGSTKIKEFGAGTEKLEEEVRRLFPQARILRMDSETARSKSSYDRMYEKMLKGEVDILIGTQMIAKGLDFENVTLVGIVAADLSLNFDDYRAQERTFQLLTQVAGRAGRAEKQGQVIIQTYRPENFVIQASKNMDYESFYKHEMEIRESFSYPPFTNLVTIKIQNEDRLKTIDQAKSFRDQLEKALDQPENYSIFGPNPCKISRINNKYRYNIIIKSSDDKLEYLMERLRALKANFDQNYQGSNFIIALNPVTVN